MYAFTSTWKVYLKWDLRFQGLYICMLLYCHSIKTYQDLDAKFQGSDVCIYVKWENLSSVNLFGVRIELQLNCFFLCFVGYSKDLFLGKEF